MDNPYRKAIEVLAERGHTKHATSDENGVCALGALSCALTGSAEEARFGSKSWSNGYAPAFEHDFAVPLAKTVLEQFPDRVNEVVDTGRPNYEPAIIANFNDHPSTTVDDVVLVLEKTAIRQDELL